MKRLIAVGLALAFLGGPAALHAQPATPPDAVLPGYWSYKTRFLGITVDNEKKCVKPDEVDKFFTAPCNRHHICSYPIRVVGNGRARFEGTWQDKKYKRKPVAVKATGTYQPKEFTVRAQALGLSATLEAKWLAATCPAGAA